MNFVNTKEYCIYNLMRVKVSKLTYPTRPLYLTMLNINTQSNLIISSKLPANTHIYQYSFVFNNKNILNSKGLFAFILYRLPVFDENIRLAGEQLLENFH